MSTIAIRHHYGENPVAICDDCGHVCRFSELDPIQDIEQRLMAGTPTPAGECPNRGALSYVEAVAYE